MAYVSIDKKCCVANCGKTRPDVILHNFPDPHLEPERFRAWVYAVGGDILALDNKKIHKYRKVCHIHFETPYKTRSKKLACNAVPTLHLPGFSARRAPMRDITNRDIVPEGEQELQQSTPSTSNANAHQIPMVNPSTSQGKTRKIRKAVCDENTALANEVKRLRKSNDSYLTRLKKAMQLSENSTFQKALRTFTTLACMFTMLQFRESGKKKMGRRFTKEEKIMALALYKQGPKAYRWLRIFFVLPSPVTLSRMISVAGLRPGINENLFKQLEKRVRKMKEHEKLCILMFDEMAIAPHLDYNVKMDYIKGFVTDGKNTKKKLADHALVFMMRGVFKNYKLPVYYSFCAGSTKTAELTVAIKDVIRKLRSVGLKVVATVCDQGSNNVSAINDLIKQTKADYMRQSKEHPENSFEIDGEEIMPLYDGPHLIKGVRNNLLEKHLKCVLGDKEKIAKWEHIKMLYEENPAYHGIRLMPKLTLNHVDPKRMNKMKVKIATQIFSATVAGHMGYLADKNILPKECQDTADVILFFDRLFDSINGSFENAKKKRGKDLLGPVTPRSKHWEEWSNAKKVLKSMKFCDAKGAVKVVPTIRNWLHTVETVERLTRKLFTDHGLTSIWLRHFNQDPLENFFGCIRSHGFRNTNPTSAGFETAFAALLINNLSSSQQSPGANCETDSCFVFKSLKNIFFGPKNETNSAVRVEIDMNDLSDNILIGIENKTNNPKIMAQIQYVTGYVLKKTRENTFKNCAECKSCLYSNNETDSYISIRERRDKRSLTYPAHELVNCFSDIQDVVTHVIRNDSTRLNIKMYTKTVLSVTANYNFITCHRHKKQIISYVEDLSCRFFLCNWCKDVNKILIGSRNDYDTNDYVQKMAVDYFNKRRKK